jgi:hypothetical protein
MGKCHTAMQKLEMCGSKNFISVPVPVFLEWKNLGSVSVIFVMDFHQFSKKKNNTNVLTDLCMFRAFLLNR